MSVERKKVVVIGAGFTGLAAAYELARRGFQVTILESDSVIGGLAAGYHVDGQPLERFYHHWLGTDQDIVALIRELGLERKLIARATATGMYYANSFHRLSSPIDILRFTPLSLWNRIRFGLSVAYSWTIRDIDRVEPLRAKDWLIGLCGRRVYEVVWEPLLVGKFGKYADEVGAAWLWNKFVQRGRSRQKSGGEFLYYYQGGFSGFIEDWVKVISSLGVSITLDTAATGLVVDNGEVRGVRTAGGVVACDGVVATPALPLIADLVSADAPAAFLQRLRAVKYLANVCLVLQLKRSLSDIYWLNVNDPSFPFVGIIEHTNFEPSSSYAGRHIVYLSKYLPRDDALFGLTDAELLEFAIPHIHKMFPSFDRDWVLSYNVWRADFAQPIVTPNYSRTRPDTRTPIAKLYISGMAHVYPQDRGTNYAIRHGRAVAAELAASLA